MIKKHKKMLILTSIVILLPIFAGLILWNDLPDVIVTHFGAHNEPNGWSSKGFAVFGLPVIVLTIHWLAVTATVFDAKSKNIHHKMLSVLLWICPSISLVLSAVTYTYAMGIPVDVGFIVMLLLGVLYIVLGNYMPKCRQNRSLGMRVSWTLSDPGNWQKTHRVAGWALLSGGVMILATAYFRIPWLFFSILAVTLLVPVLYSYVYYRRHQARSGKEENQ